MFRSQLFGTFEIPTKEDYNALGEHPRESFDAIVKDFGGFPALRYQGFTVAQIGVASVQTGQGRIYDANGAGYIFDAENGETTDFLDYLPATVKRIATIVAYGSTINTEVLARTYLTDVDTRAKEGRENPTVNLRKAEVGFVLGTEAATPSPPSIPSNQVAIAHVVLTPAGVESVTQITANKVITNHQLGADVTLINGRLNAFGSQMATLRTDISGVSSNVRTKASSEMVRILAKEIARLKDQARLPDDYVEFAADTFWNEDESDTEAAGYAARVYRGLRFPSAGEVTTHISLANPIDPSLKVEGGMAIPKSSDVVRLSMVGSDSERPLANTTSVTREARTVTEARQEQVLTGTERVAVVNDVDGTTWEATRIGGVGGHMSSREYYARGEEVPSNYEKLSSVTSGEGSVVTFYDRNNYSTVMAYDTRTEWVTNTENIAGSWMARSFLNSQEGFLSGVDLYFTKKADAGEIRVLLVDTDASGQPMLDRVLEQTTIQPEDINIYPAATAVDIKPVHLRKGGKYAIVLVSSAAHYVAEVNGPTIDQGTIFDYVDGQWQPDGNGRGIAMQLRYRQYDSTYVVVGLAALELAGGIDSIRINADVAIPEAGDIVYQIFVGGKWRALNEGADGVNLLAGRPSLVQFRAVLIGTVDVMPALGIGPTRSEIILTRPASSLTHISTARQLMAPTDQVVLEMRIENWDGDNGHTLVVTLLTGAGYASTETPDATETFVSLDGAATIKRFTFDVSAIDDYKIKAIGGLGGSGKTFHISERLDTEF